MVNAPVCWLAWLAVLKVSPSPAVSHVTIIPLVIVIATTAAAMFGTFGVKGVLPTVTPIPIARSRFRRWVTVWIVLVVVSLVLGTIVFSRVNPPSEAGLVGSATRMHDGRYALVSHGNLVRYLSPEEYREILTSEMLGMIAIVLALSLVFAALVGARLWRRTDREDFRESRVPAGGGSA
jgi:hypothetical protein